MSHSLTFCFVDASHRYRSFPSPVHNSFIKFTVGSNNLIFVAYDTALHIIENYTAIAAPPLNFQVKQLVYHQEQLYLLSNLDELFLWSQTAKSVQPFPWGRSNPEAIESLSVGSNEIAVLTCRKSVVLLKGHRRLKDDCSLFTFFQGDRLFILTDGGVVVVYQGDEYLLEEGPSLPPGTLLQICGTKDACLLGIRDNGLFKLYYYSDTLFDLLKDIPSSDVELVDLQGSSDGSGYLLLKSTTSNTSYLLYEISQKKVTLLPCDQITAIFSLAACKQGVLFYGEAPAEIEVPERPVIICSDIVASASRRSSAVSKFWNRWTASSQKDICLELLLGENESSSSGRLNSTIRSQCSPRYLLPRTHIASQKPPSLLRRYQKSASTLKPHETVLANWSNAARTMLSEAKQTIRQAVYRPLNLMDPLIEAGPPSFTVLPLLKEPYWNDSQREVVAAFELFRHQLVNYWNKVQSIAIPQVESPADLRASFRALRPRLERLLGEKCLQKTPLDKLGFYGSEIVILNDIERSSSGESETDHTPSRILLLALYKALVYQFPVRHFWTLDDLASELPINSTTMSFFEFIPPAEDAGRLEYIRRQALQSASQLFPHLVDGPHPWEATQEELWKLENSTSLQTPYRCFPRPYKHQDLNPIWFRGRLCYAVSTVHTVDTASDLELFLFLRQIFIMAGLIPHENLAPLVGAVTKVVSSSPHRLWLLTDWPLYGTLWDCAHESVSDIPLSLRLEIIEGVARGLKALHGSGYSLNGSLTSYKVLIGRHFIPKLFLLSGLTKVPADNEEDDSIALQGLLCEMGLKQGSERLKVALPHTGNPVPLVQGGALPWLSFPRKPISSVFPDHNEDNYYVNSPPLELRKARGILGDRAAILLPKQRRKLRGIKVSTRTEHSVNIRDDIYAFGVIMWEVWHRTPPFFGTTPNGSLPVVTAGNNKFKAMLEACQKRELKISTVVSALQTWHSMCNKNFLWTV